MLTRKFTFGNYLQVINNEGEIKVFLFNDDKEKLLNKEDEVKNDNFEVMVFEKTDTQKVFKHRVYKNGEKIVDKLMERRIGIGYEAIIDDDGNEVEQGYMIGDALKLCKKYSIKPYVYFIIQKSEKSGLLNSFEIWEDENFIEEVTGMTKDDVVKKVNTEYRKKGAYLYIIQRGNYQVFVNGKLKREFDTDFEANNYSGFLMNQLSKDDEIVILNQISKKKGFGTFKISDRKIEEIEIEFENKMFPSKKVIKNRPLH